MSYYVKRSQGGRMGWIGPFRSQRRAGAEVNAWRAAGWDSYALASTPEVRAMVKAWEKSVKQDRR